MTAHNHREIVPGCFRCDLGRAEVAAQAWQDALVVRDRLGQLRHAGGFLDEPITAGLDPLEVAVFADTFGPMVPILGRTGLPVVTTVGDLTARHIGKLVRIGKTPTATLTGLSWREVGVQVHLFTPDAEAAWQNLPLNTPCEVLS